MSVVDKVKSINAAFYPQHLFYSPEWLVLGVNNICNLHCKMCDVGNGNTESNFSQNLVGSRPLHMPMELIKTIFDQAAMYFPKVKIGYAFTEPLVYLHLEESLQYAKEKNLYTSITTNALTLPQKAEMLCENEVDDIFISLDGTEEIHNYIRGNKNSFQKAIEGIEKLLSIKKHPEISVFFVITEWNVLNMKSFVDYFKKFPLKQLGFMHTNFTPLHIAQKHNLHHGDTYHSTLSNTTEIDLKKMDLNELFNQITKIKTSSYPFPITFSPEISSLDELKRFYLNPELFIGKKCNDVSRNIMIKSDGSVIPAHGRCYNLNIGNVYHDNLKSIWNSEVISKFRKDLNNAGGLFPACSRCCSAF
jgi:radical SAM protein with 4Fe4S-binding SPASM domain